MGAIPLGRRGAVRTFLSLATFLPIYSLCALKQAEAGTINARSTAFTDVAAAVALAANGDTILIPGGTAAWSNTLTISKAVTLQGTTAVSGPSSAPKVSNGTVISNNVGNLIVLNTSTGVVRITGMTFQKGTSSGLTIQVLSGTPNFRIDHCAFYSQPSYSLWVMNERGVIDHNYAELVTTFFEPHPQNWGGGSFGDASFAAPLELGTDHAIYAEDNFARDVSATKVNLTAFVDSQAGARYVIRFNTLLDCHVVTHGTESGQRMRAPRSWEIYNNTFLRSSNTAIANNLAATRGGTGLMFGNAATGTYQWFNRMLNYRDAEDFPFFKGASGICAWDLNDAADHSGNGFSGGSGGKCAGGTHSGPNGSTQLTVSGSPWVPNQWVKYTVRNLRTGRFSLITANGTSTINYLGATQVPVMTWNTGDPFEIRKVQHALDHPGAGQCDLLTGTTPAPRWLHQIREPIYIFNNTLNGSRTTPVSSDYNVVQNLDYYMENPSFNGTSGVGVGPLANRPATCVKGVAYWATDQGEWDSTHNGPDGQLYVATATNTWTRNYTPYVYPHPLVSGNSPPPTPTPTATPIPTPTPTATPNATPNPPTNLRVVPGS
jgi:hypothetical protein